MNKLIYWKKLGVGTTLGLSFAAPVCCSFLWTNVSVLTTELSITKDDLTTTQDKLTTTEVELKKTKEDLYVSEGLRIATEKENQNLENMILELGKENAKLKELNEILKGLNKTRLRDINDYKKKIKTLEARIKHLEYQLWLRSCNPGTEEIMKHDFNNFFGRYCILNNKNKSLEYNEDLGSDLYKELAKAFKAQQ